MDYPTPEHRQKEAQIQRQIELDDLATILKLKQGRRFIWRFLKDGRIFHDCCDLSNVQRTYKLLGARNLALKYYAEIIEHHPELYLLMCKENPAPKPTAPEPGED